MSAIYSYSSTITTTTAATTTAIITTNITTTTTINFLDSAVVIISLHSIKQLIFAMEKRCVLSEIRTEFVSII
jgi:hypothetical protein